MPSSRDPVGAARTAPVVARTQSVATAAINLSPSRLLARKNWDIHTLGQLATSRSHVALCNNTIDELVPESLVRSLSVVVLDERLHSAIGDTPCGVTVHSSPCWADPRAT